MKIQILGTGCPKCQQLTENAENAAKELGLDYEIEKVTEVNDIMKEGEAAGEHILDFRGTAETIFLGEKQSDAYDEWRSQYARGRGVGGRAPRYQTSQFWLERGPATVDYKGEVVERYGITVSGYFAFERVADEVPKEYRPR